MWKWTLRFKASPKRCTKVTAPHPDLPVGGRKARPAAQRAEYGLHKYVQDISEQGRIVSEAIA
jgi:hypothetical protein